MRRILIAFFTSIFFLSGFLGFGVVHQVRAIAEVNPGPLTPANQINLILVHVDDLKLSQPRLTSIWGIFITRSVFPGLIVKRIYPESSSPISAKLAVAFALDEKKQLDEKFMDSMRDLDMPAAEIVLVDNKGLSEVLQTISPLSMADFSNEIQDANQPDRTAANDLDLFQQVCAAIETPANSVPVLLGGAPPANDLGTASVATDSLDKWKGLVTSLHFASCEVLAGP